MKAKNQEFDFSVKGKKRKREYNLLKDLLAISEEIYSARISLKLSQQDLAKKVGTTQKVISKIENAEVNLGVDLILRISRELGLQFKLGNFLSLPKLGEGHVLIHNFVFHNLEDIKKNQINYGQKEPYYTAEQSSEMLVLKRQ
jgi:transcriptional regulator with XRE-family HTH domain